MDKNLLVGDLEGDWLGAGVVEAEGLMLGLDVGLGVMGVAFEGVDVGVYRKGRNKRTSSSELQSVQQMDLKLKTRSLSLTDVGVDVGVPEGVLVGVDVGV